MFENVLLLVSLGLQALMTYLGVKLSLDPVVTPQERTRYKVGFIAILALGVLVTIGQQRMSSEAQQRLQNDIDALRKGVGNVEEQTKQPPNVIVNVPPAQVIVSQASGGPLPAYRLTGYDYPKGMNDPVWRALNGMRVRIDWRQMDGIDAFAELYVWAKECGIAQARIFDETTNSVAVEGTPVKAWSSSTPFDIFDCKPAFQRLKLPRDKAAHTYILQAFAGGGAYATAIGEIVLERTQSTSRQQSIPSDLSAHLLKGTTLIGEAETAEPEKYNKDARDWRNGVLKALRDHGLDADAAIFESRSVPPLPRLVTISKAANRQTWQDLIIDTTNLRNLIQQLQLREKQ